MHYFIRPILVWQGFFERRQISVFIYYAIYIQHVIVLNAAVGYFEFD